MISKFFLKRLTLIKFSQAKFVQALYPGNITTQRLDNIFVITDHFFKNLILFTFIEIRKGPFGKKIPVVLEENMLHRLSVCFNFHQQFKNGILFSV